jgi:hypothetical protein
MRVVLLILVVSIMACNTKKKFGGELYKNYKDKAFLYKNDSLNFSITYWGGSYFLLNPNKKQCKELSSDFPKNIMPKFDGSVLLFKKSFDKELFGYVQVQMNNLEKQKITNLSTINRYIKPDSLSTIEDSLNPRKAIKFHYFLHDDNNKFVVVDYLLSLSERQTLRIVEFTKSNKDKKFKYLPDYNLANTIKSFQNDIKKENNKTMSIPYNYIHQSFRDYNYNYLNAIDAVEKLRKKDAKLENSSINANFYSFVGEYKKMLSDRDTDTPKFNWTSKDSLELETYNLKNAKEEILKNTKDKQVIMFNENHLNPHSRVFVADLLRDLKQQGFSYFGVETLTSSISMDSTLNFRKYPLQKSGYYTAEPCFGNLIRTALQEDFNVFSYEYNTQSDSTGKFQKRNHREKSQALNILKILEKNPKAKIIVYAGHDHIQKKSSNPQVKMMASYFKLLSGIEPFCIEQATMIEGYDETKEHPAYKQINKKNSPCNSIVLEKDGNYWTTSERKGSYEMCIFHCRSQYENNYPTWLVNSTGNKNYEIKIDNLKKYQNNILQIYIKKEYDEQVFEAVPIINRIIHDTKQPQIKLKKGEYTILVFDKYKNALYKENVKIN